MKHLLHTLILSVLQAAMAMATQNYSLSVSFVVASFGFVSRRIANMSWSSNVDYQVQMACIVSYHMPTQNDKGKILLAHFGLILKTFLCCFLSYLSATSNLQGTTMKCEINEMYKSLQSISFYLFSSKRSAI